MAGLAKDWFESSVPAPRGPDAPIEHYVYSPPRGMTCAPQNPKVRAKLLQDLADYGIPFENPSYNASSWPPPVPSKEKQPAKQNLGALSRTTQKKPAHNGEHKCCDFIIVQWQYGQKASAQTTTLVEWQA